MGKTNDALLRFAKVMANSECTTKDHLTSKELSEILNVEHLEVVDEGFKMLNELGKNGIHLNHDQFSPITVEGTRRKVEGGEAVEATAIRFDRTAALAISMHFNKKFALKACPIWNKIIKEAKAKNERQEVAKKATTETTCYLGRNTGKGLQIISNSINLLKTLASHGAVNETPEEMARNVKMIEYAYGLEKTLRKIEAEVIIAKTLQPLTPEEQKERRLRREALKTELKESTVKFEKTIEVLKACQKVSK